MIYLDHAATSYPKPPDVIRAMVDFLERAGGNPGRSGHLLSAEAGRIVYDARETVAQFFNAGDPMRVFFTQNATYALNTALFGLLRAGDKVVTTGIEHNSVMRPLRELERRGIALKIVPCGPTGDIDLDDFRQAFADGAKLAVFNHASNVVGQVFPVDEMARVAHEYDALVLLDAAQTAGVRPIDVRAMGVDLLAFTGHKGLQGPTGTGGLLVSEDVDINEMQPLVRGGTGSRSESEEQPDVLPDKFESGTPNGAGIAGLAAGVRWVSERGVDQILAHHIDLITRLTGGLADIPGVTMYGPPPGTARSALVSFTVQDMRVSEVGHRLDEEFKILSRVGLHCAPGAHKTIGTFPEGTVRFAVGPMTTLEDVDAAVNAVEEIAQR